MEEILKIQEEYPKNKAIKEGKIKGYKYWITQGSMGGLNGYVAFPKRPVIETGYDGIMVYVPVHGGITYAEQGKLGMVYGFDTAHFDSEKSPRNDKKWIKKQCAKMIEGILMVKKVEKKYLLAKTNKEKLKLVQMVLDIDAEEENNSNLGMNINLLTGRL